jgi:NADH-ubiquinone oxidoreductase chain 5
MSQLGMMVIAVGLSSYNIALFHLVNHAFYKALLFLGAGAVIHAVADNQDFRRYGGLRPFLPLTYSVMLIASLSLVAFPFMTGFYSKDFILESAYGQYYFSSTVVYIIATIGAMFTTLYSVKVLYLTFLTNPNGPIISYKQAHEGDIFMSLPLMILAVFSIFFGFITKDMFIGLGSGFFSDNALFIHPSHEIMLDTEFGVATLFKLLPLMFTVLLSVLSITFSEFLPSLLISFKLSRVGYNIFSFFNQRFLIELFYNRFITGVILKIGGQTTKVIDKGSVECLGPFGLERVLLNLSNRIAVLNTGVVTSYGLYLIIGLALLMLSFLNSDEKVTILLSIMSLSLLLYSKYLPTPLTFDNLPLKSSIFSQFGNNFFKRLISKFKRLIKFKRIISVNRELSENNVFGKIINLFNKKIDLDSLIFYSLPYNMMYTVITLLLLIVNPMLITSPTPMTIKNPTIGYFFAIICCHCILLNLVGTANTFYSDNGFELVECSVGGGYANILTDSDEDTLTDGSVGSETDPSDPSDYSSNGSSEQPSPPASPPANMTSHFSD